MRPNDYLDALMARLYRMDRRTPHERYLDMMTPGGSTEMGTAMKGLMVARMQHAAGWDAVRSNTSWYTGTSLARQMTNTPLPVALGQVPSATRGLGLPDAVMWTGIIGGVIALVVGSAVGQNRLWTKEMLRGGRGHR